MDGPSEVPVTEVPVLEDTSNLRWRHPDPPPALREPIAREIMSVPAIACHQDASLEIVADLLVDREVSGVPVVDSAGALVGVISERDLADALGAPLLRLAMGHSMTTGSFLRRPRLRARARDIMSSPPIFVDANTPLRELAHQMVTHGVNRIPIVAEGRLMGVASRGDVLAAVAGLNGESLPERARPPVIIGSPSGGSGGVREGRRPMPSPRRWYEGS